MRERPPICSVPALSTKCPQARELLAALCRWLDPEQMPRPYNHSSIPIARRLAAALTLMLGVMALVGVAPSPAAAAVTCNQFASPSGSDSNSGSITSPYLTVQKLVNSLSSGQTGCLLGGTYGSPSSTTTFSTPGITITSYPGQSATIDGYPLIRGAGTTLSYLNFDVDNTGDGTHCPGETKGAYSLDIEASNVTLAYDNIYQTDVPTSLRAVGIGVGWSYPVSGVVIRNNRIHDFGHCDGLDHGIYVDQSTGAQIYDNWIYNIPHGAGVQLYPNPSGSQVYDNIIDNTGIGLFLSGGSNVSNNHITNNVISNSTGLPANHLPPVGISTYWSGSAGTGNTFTGNDVFNDSGGTCDPCNGVTVSGTLSSDPQYVSKSTNNYQVASTSPMASWSLWSGSSAVTPLPLPTPVATVPSAPANVKATGANAQIAVSWAANPVGDHVTQYNVYRTDQTFSGPWATVTPTTFTNASGVVAGTRYCYQISATNSAGEGPKSAPVCATPAATVPAVPTGVKAVAAKGGVVLSLDGRASSLPSDRLPRVSH